MGSEVDSCETIESAFPLEKHGEGGIRTHEQVAPLLDFESSSFGHSDTSPYETYPKLKQKHFQAR